MKIIYYSFIILILIFINCQTIQKPVDASYQNTFLIPVYIEGDSWFDLCIFYNIFCVSKDIPKFLNNNYYEIGVKDPLYDNKNLKYFKYKVISVAKAGQELNQMITPKFIHDIIEHKPVAFILSGGGNDILRNGLNSIVRDNKIYLKCRSGNPKNSMLDCYIDENELSKKIKEINGILNSFLRAMPAVSDVVLEQTRIESSNKSNDTSTFQIKKDIPVFIHGYSYIVPRKKVDCNFFQKISIGCKWAEPILTKKGITDLEVQKEIMSFLLKKYNNSLEDFAKRSNKRFYYVNNLPIVGENEWYDEIHPNAIGAKKVALNFHKNIVKGLIDVFKNQPDNCSKE